MNAYHERITKLFDEYYAAPKKKKKTTVFTLIE